MPYLTDSIYVRFQSILQEQYPSAVTFAEAVIQLATQPGRLPNNELVSTNTRKAAVQAAFELTAINIIQKVWQAPPTAIVCVVAKQLRVRMGYVYDSDDVAMQPNQLKTALTAAITLPSQSITPQERGLIDRIIEFFANFFRRNQTTDVRNNVVTELQRKIQEAQETTPRVPSRLFVTAKAPHGITEELQELFGNDANAVNVDDNHNQRVDKDQQDAQRKAEEITNRFHPL